LGKIGKNVKNRAMQATDAGSFGNLLKKDIM
jgi:hypothetical protein